MRKGRPRATRRIARRFAEPAAPGGGLICEFVSGRAARCFVMMVYELNPPHDAN